MTNKFEGRILETIQINPVNEIEKKVYRQAVGGHHVIRKTRKELSVNKHTLG